MAFVPIAAVLCSFPKGDRKDNTQNYEFSFPLHAKAFDLVCFWFFFFCLFFDFYQLLLNNCTMEKVNDHYQKSNEIF